MKLGFIGLGIMGSRMAANLLRHGHELVIHNRSPDKAADLIQHGARWADTPAETATDVDVLITMLAHPQAVKAMALGEHGFLDALPAGNTWIDSSTVDPAFSHTMAQAAHERNLRFLDAPVAGTKPQAEQAQLVFFVGGDTEDLTRCQPLFEAMGQKVVHVGAQGQGIAIKMVVNMLLGISMAAFAEGVALGQALGISEETLHKILIGGPVTAPFIAAKQAKLASGDYQADFPLQWMHKDLHLALESAYNSGTSAFITSITKELYSQALQAGYAEQDFAAMYEYLTKNV